LMLVRWLLLWRWKLNLLAKHCNLSLIVIQRRAVVVGGICWGGGWLKLWIIVIAILLIKVDRSGIVKITQIRLIEAIYSVLWNLLFLKHLTKSSCSSHIIRLRWILIWLNSCVECNIKWFCSTFWCQKHLDSFICWIVR
jgi:hypothetical protein